MVTEPVARRRFRPAFWPTLVVLPVLMLMISLGLWQLDRAQQKIEIRDAVRAKGRLPELEIGAMEITRDHRYRRAHGSGKYEPRYGFLLDNKVHQGRAGYHVMTPFKPGSGEQWILVNRGWVPWGADRSHLPDIPTPVARVSVTGRLVLPETIPLKLGEIAEAGFERRWQSVETERFARVTGLSVAPLILQLDPKAEHGFVRVWPSYSDHWIDRHKGYAVQWFALAFVLLVLYFILSFKRTTNAYNSKQS